MSDGNKAAAGLRERLTTGTEDKIGRALVDLIENPLITGTIGRAFDARERAAQAQELALSALNIPTAADIERLTRRLRSVSQRLEGIEDGVHRINRALSEGSVERRLVAMEEQLKALSSKLSAPSRPSTQASLQRAQGSSASARSASAKTSTSAKSSVGPKKPASKRAARTAKSKKTA
ncbi:MAG TPA: hypothetical protein VK691_04315 [Solirubrobacteraceae bacterium]|jgi:hypothetical protein|nr:hypothetical protein [Solirubrobacteraceae bacterium]